MTKSELIDRLAAQFPQLVAKDAELAVKMILDAMAESLAKGAAHRDPRVRQLRPQLPAAAHRTQPQVRRKGAGAREVRAALQGRQGAARAGRLQTERGERRRAAARSSAGLFRCSSSLHVFRGHGAQRAMSVVRWLFGGHRSRVRRSCCCFSLQNTDPVTLRFSPVATAMAGAAGVRRAGRVRGRRRARPARGALRKSRAQAPRSRCAAAPGGAAAPARPQRRTRAAPGQAPASIRQPTSETASRAPQRRWTSSSGGCCRSPVFFALGWIAARIDIKHLLTESRALPLSYFRGLNFLLNEQPDKAIESFIEVVKVDPQTIDLHFALGSLFRRRARSTARSACTRTCSIVPTLDGQARDGDVRAGAGLPRAGLLDRAEDLFAKLDGTPYEHAALGFLLDLRAGEGLAEGDRDRERMDAVTKPPHYKEIAQYHCELAQAALLQSEFGAARTEIDDGAGRVPRMRARQRCSPATSTAQPATTAGGRRLAAHRIAEPRVPGAGRRSLSPTRTAGSATCRQGIRVLRNWQALSVARPPERAVLADAAHEGAGAAAELVKDELARSPTLLGLDRLLEAQLLARRRAAARPRAGEGLVGQHIKRPGLYRCEQCGFRARQYYWRCPGCQKWETYSPKRPRRRVSRSRGSVTFSEAEGCRTDPRVIVALDFPDAARRALRWSRLDRRCAR